MSHIVTIKTEVRDPAAVVAACRRLRLPEPVQIFNARAVGLVQTPGWTYGSVVDATS